MRGYLNRKKAVGYHYEPGATGAKVVKYTSPPDANSVYKGKVAIKGEGSNQWILKKNESTFFPQSWSEARVKYEITEAYKKGSKYQQLKEPFIGVTPSGIPVQFVPPARRVSQWRG